MSNEWEVRARPGADVSEESLETVRKIINNPEFAERARRLAITSMLTGIPPAELLAREHFPDDPDWIGSYLGAKD
jgi:hypothetical protein